MAITVAVLRPIGLGGLLLAVPALRALRAGFLEAEITLVSLPGAIDFAHRFGHYIDRFVPFYGFPDPRDEPHTPFLVRGPLPDRTEDERYDLVVQLLDGSARSNGWARALGGRMTVGYVTEEAPEHLTLAATYPEHLSETERMLRLTSMIGCDASNDALEFPLFLEDHGAARHALERERHRGAQPNVALHVDVGTDASYVASVADEIGRLSGASTVVVGNGSAGVRARMRTPAHEIETDLSLGVLAAVFSRMQVVVTTGTDMTRLAEAVGSPALEIRADRSPELYAHVAREMLVRAAAV